MKLAAGNDAARAGLVNGTLYAVSVAGMEGLIERKDVPLSGRFSLLPLRSATTPDGSIASLTDDNLLALYETTGGTYFLRPEDAAWHPRAPRRFVLATTDPSASRLYRFEFDDIAAPEKGGTLRSLLAPAAPSLTNGVYVQQLDNVAVDGERRDAWRSAAQVLV